MEAWRDPQRAKVPKDKLSFGFLQRVRPGLPQFGLPARPHAAGLVQGGRLRAAAAVRHGTGLCSRAQSSNAPW